MTSKKQQGDNLFNLCRLINEHNKKYDTTYNIVEIDRKEFDKFNKEVNWKSTNTSSNKLTKK